MSDILTDAERLKKNSLQKKSLKENIHGILRQLNDEILSAKSVGNMEIKTTIPITFTSPNMSNKNAQRIIWSSIIKELNEKKYRVSINPKGDKCTLLIKWISKEEEKVVKEQMDLIASHVNKNL